MQEYKRVKYNKSPLVEVIFQLRFPTILSINSKQPVDFQEKIRECYPLYQEEIEQQNELFIAPDGNPAQIRQSQNKNYSFISADGLFKVNLTSSFIAISTMGYTQWEDFTRHIEFVVPLFEEEYRPAFYTRVGLRYVDAITSIGKRYPFRKIVRFLSADSGRFLLVGKFPKPTAFPLNTYNTTQSNFAEVLREFFQKFFLISYYGKVSKMPNKSERKKLQTAKIITLSNLLFSYG